MIRTQKVSADQIKIHLVSLILSPEGLLDLSRQANAKKVPTRKPMRSSNQAVTPHSAASADADAVKPQSAPSVDRVIIIVRMWRKE